MSPCDRGLSPFSQIESGIFPCCYQKAEVGELGPRCCPPLCLRGWTQRQEGPVVIKSRLECFLLQRANFTKVSLLPCVRATSSSACFLTCRSNSMRKHNSRTRLGKSLINIEPDCPPSSSSFLLSFCPHLTQSFHITKVTAKLM